MISWGSFDTVQSSGPLFSCNLQENFGIQRGLTTNTGANLLQPGKGTTLVEWRCDGAAHRS